MSTDTAPRPPKSATPEILTGSGAILRSLEHLGITDVFGLPGGAIMPFYDELMSSASIRHILVRHEQGAGHAAEGYASSTGKVGVAIATSGPGATNLVTAIADAHGDFVLKINALYLLQKAVHKVLAGLLAVTNDVQAGIFLQFDP